MSDDEVIREATKRIEEHLADKCVSRPAVTTERHLGMYLQPDGSIHVRAGRCRDCKHWDQGAAPDGREGDCRATAEAREGGWSTDDDVPFTSPDFGCVLWEQKT